MNPLIEKAKAYGIKAHEGKFRTNIKKEPYSVHIGEVARLTEESGGSAEEIAAAWLHDTVEDTEVTLDNIRTEFGETVARIVEGLTDPVEYEGMPTLERKTLQAERVKTKSDSVKRVKIADQISNTVSLVDFPPLSWNEEKCIAYVEGARRIVESCRGVSDFLENKFNASYEANVQKYGKHVE